MSFLRLIFTESWKFFQIQIPGLNISFGGLAIGLLLVDLGFNVLQWILKSGSADKKEGDD